jgi:hypothetical protein
MKQMVSILDLATTIRSKQAGPFRLSLDIIFKSRDIYEWVKGSGVINRNLIAHLYSVPESHITAFVYYDAGWAIKATLVRPKVAGDPGDGDVYGCQQHAPLLTIQVPCSNEQ